MLIQELLVEAKTLSLPQAEEIAKKLRDAHGSIKGDEHYEKVLKRLEQYYGKDVANAFDSAGNDSGDKLHYQQKISKPHALLVKHHAAIVSTVKGVKESFDGLAEAKKLRTAAEILADIKAVNKSMDAIINDGGMVPMNDPLSIKFSKLQRELDAAKAAAKKSRPVKEGILEEKVVARAIGRFNDRAETLHDDLEKYVETLKQRTPPMSKDVLNSLRKAIGALAIAADETQEAGVAADHIENNLKEGAEYDGSNEFDDDMADAAAAIIEAKKKARKDVEGYNVDLKTALKILNSVKMRKHVKDTCENVFVPKSPKAVALKKVYDDAKQAVDDAIEAGTQDNIAATRTAIAAAERAVDKFYSVMEKAGE